MHTTLLLVGFRAGSVIGAKVLRAEDDSNADAHHKLEPQVCNT